MDGRQDKDDEVQPKIQRDYNGRQTKIPTRKGERRRTETDSKVEVQK